MDTWRKKSIAIYALVNHGDDCAIFRCRASSGLTLVELIVSVSILSILTAIAVPQILNWIPDYRLKRAVKDLYSNMQLARLTAIKSGSTCSILFSGDPDRYTVGTVNRTILLAQYKSGVKYGHPASESPIPSGNMVFSPSGLLNPPSRYAYLSNAGNTDYYRIGALTSGIIRTQKWNGSGWE